ncbi:DUF5916 domain-containing protein [uncultured Croceitalea sp.]|uniref:carbohydrate binding family 9 domain-containing protein n=1 Tax=uncultured Croceitalea sp. TaxID=1798908 RepID=UPI003305BD89
MFKYLDYGSLLFCIVPSIIFAQELATERLNYQITKSNSEIILDGIPDEEEWDRHGVITSFFNHFPVDQGQADNQTEVRVTYNDEYIYFLAKMHDNGNRVIQSLDRDNDQSQFFSDAFTVVLDPTNKQQNGFLFGVNAAGAEMEATLELFGSQTIYAPNWDQRWFSATQQFEDYWIAEIAIPFRSLRYNKDNLTWGLNFMRIDREKFMNSTWTLFPVNFNSIDMNYMGTITWDRPIESKTRLLTFNPYATFSSSRNYEDINQNRAENKTDVGGDIKVNLSSTLNLDLTILPDFSNADVDQEITNITRFNIFLPEQRNFFLDNADIFSSFGAGTIRPFFSRRIGLSNGNPIPIDFGARLTGNLTPGLRIGIMDIQTSETSDFFAQNYAVAAFQQRVFKRSALKALFINRQATSGTLTDSDYSRNAGIEFDYITPNGDFNNTFRFHTALTSEGLNQNHYYGVKGNYSSKYLRAGWLLENVGKNFITEVGINPRLENFNAETEETIRVGFTKLNPWIRYWFINDDQKKKIAQHGANTWHVIYFNPDGTLNESNNNLDYTIDFRNTSTITLNNRFNRVNLLFPTALIGDEFAPLPPDGYSFFRSSLQFRTDRRKLFILEGNVNYGGFYNGTLLNSMLEANYRIQPWANFGLVYDYNKVKLQESFGERELHLLRFTGNLTFTKNLLFSNVVQYNTQSDNFSVFSRFQWRYAPMSDLFVIFNQNQNTSGLGVQNRGLILKLTYWL